MSRVYSSRAVVMNCPIWWKYLNFFTRFLRLLECSYWIDGSYPSAKRDEREREPIVKLLLWAFSPPYKKLYKKVLLEVGVSCLWQKRFLNKIILRACRNNSCHSSLMTCFSVYFLYYKIRIIFRNIKRTII